MRGLIIATFIIATWLLGAGCPAPRHALSIEVRSGGQPVPSAVVALLCAPGGSGQLTDERGRAIFKLPVEQPLDRCRLVAGKVGFETEEERQVRACPGRAGRPGRQGPQEPPVAGDCPTVEIELVELGGDAAAQAQVQAQVAR